MREDQNIATIQDLSNGTGKKLLVFHQRLNFLDDVIRNIVFVIVEQRLQKLAWILQHNFSIVPVIVYFLTRLKLERLRKCNISCFQFSNDKFATKKIRKNDFDSIYIFQSETNFMSLFTMIFSYHFFKG